MIKTIIALLLVALTSVQAADKYVRKGATGNGSDWANAYGEFNAVNYSGLGTLYIAAGAYTTNLPTMNGLSNITIKRATSATHGTNTGWQNSYDGQVTVTGSKFLNIQDSSNITIDGGGTKEPWLFSVIGHQSSNGRAQIEGSTNVTFRYIDMNGGGCQPDQENGPEDALRLGGNTNIVIEHNWIHDYWYCTGNANNPGHADAIQMPSVNGAIIRYNKIADSGMLLFFGDCSWGNQWANNVHVHHNIFLQRGGNLGSKEANYRINDMKGVQQTSSSHVIFENNTFVAESGWSGATHYENADCRANTTRRVFRNNIYVNGQFSLSSGNGTVSHNICFGGQTWGSNALTSNPLFVNQAGYNYRLKSGSPAADSGTNASLGYGDTLTVDYDGVPIGAQRSRGAFEPSSGQPTPTPQPTATPTPQPTATPSPTPPGFAIGGRIELTATETNVQVLTRDQIGQSDWNSAKRSAGNHLGWIGDNLG